MLGLHLIASTTPVAADTEEIEGYVVKKKLKIT